MYRSLLEPNRLRRNLPTFSENADRPSPSFSQKLTSIDVSLLMKFHASAWRCRAIEKQNRPYYQSREGACARSIRMRGDDRTGTIFCEETDKRQGRSRRISCRVV